MVLTPWQLRRVADVQQGPASQDFIAPQAESGTRRETLHMLAHGAILAGQDVPVVECRPLDHQVLAEALHRRLMRPHVQVLEETAGALDHRCRGLGQRVLLARAPFFHWE